MGDALSRRRTEGHAASGTGQFGVVENDAVTLDEVISRIPEWTGATVAVSALSRYHAGPTFPGLFSALETVRDYLRISRSGAPLPSTIDRMVERAETIDGAMRALPRPSRSCHNDLLLGNFLDDGQQIRIVDWEYAAMGDPFFDLGNFAAHLSLSDDQETMLLDAYLGQAPAPELARLKLMKILSDLRGAMWAMVQVTISTLNYDFVAYGQRDVDHNCRIRLTPAGAGRTDWRMADCS